MYINRFPTDTCKKMLVHIQTSRLRRIAVDLSPDGRPVCYLFAGKNRVYTEDQQKRWSRLIKLFAAQEVKL